MTEPECAECGRNDTVGVVRRLYFCTRHEDKVRGMARTAEFRDRHHDDEPTPVRSALAGGHWL